MGVLPDHEIAALVRSGAVTQPAGAPAIRVQPCSLDLTLSREAWRLPASVLPIGESVRSLVERLGRRRVDLGVGEVLDREKVYVVRLEEGLKLPRDVAAYCNTKSSIGRLDLQTRVLTDGNPRYDRIPRGYSGDVWLEVISKSFDIALRAGASLNQAIFFRERKILLGGALAALEAREPLLFSRDGSPLRADPDRLDEGGLLLTVDLDQDPVGWVARKTPQEIDLSGARRNDAAEYFEPVPRPRDGALWLRRGHFYILSTREFLRVPPDFAVEMLPFENSAGEFRAHYAGFFDPGFGWSPGGATRGTPAVLEVRPYDDDLILRHGQPICKVAFEALSSRPQRAYGEGSGNHYQDQRGPKLSRHLSVP